MALVLSLFMASAHAQDYEFETVVGGFVGDGLPASQAALVAPRGIVLDAAGNAYIAQKEENRIRKIAADGTISTLAGDGTYGFGGDGGPAASALLRGPQGVALDASGNLYFSDTGNNRIRRISTAGIITTVAGDGQAGSGGDGGSALSASLNEPYGLAFDGAGNLYVAEQLGHRIRKIDGGGTITTVAGTGVAGDSGDGGAAIAAQLNWPMSLAVDSAGNLYVSDSQNNRVRRIAQDGIITTVAGGGADFPPFADGTPATSAALFLPFGIAVDAADNLYIVDNNCFIHKVDPAGALYKVAGGEGYCTTTGDGGPAVDANVFGPEAVAIAGNGDIYFTDSGDYIVRRISAGFIDTVAGVGVYYGDGGPATGAVLSLTDGVTVDAAGDLYVADGYPNGRIRKAVVGGGITTIAGNGSMTSSGDGGPAIDAGMLYPKGVAFDSAGNLYIADYAGNRIRKVATDGTISTVAGTGQRGFGGDGGPATAARLSRPSRVAIDGAGNLYIADRDNHRIRKVATDGIISTVAGNGVRAFGGDGGPATDASLAAPIAVVFDANGSLLIADYGNNRVRKVDTAGTISTVAGNGLYGPAGDGGPATDAALTGPAGLAVDSQDNLYIVGPTLRKVAADGTISTLRGMKYRGSDVAVDSDDNIFVTVSSGRVLKAVPARAAQSDYDGDGASDLFWRNTATGANAVWPSADVAVAYGAMAVPEQAWTVAGSGDFDGDGKADLLWRNGATGAGSVWKSADAASSYYLTTVSDPAWKIAGVGDFDADGKSDIAWRNAGTGANAIWRSGDSSTQQPTAPVYDAAWRIAGVGDYDGDGHADLFWRNGSSGANAVWPSGDASAARAVAPVYNLAWKVAGVGDFDGDGEADLLWRNDSTGGNTVWNSADPATAHALSAVYDQNWRIDGTGDYDGDGKADILWRHAVTGVATIWKGGDASQQRSVARIADTNWKIVD